MPIASSFSQTAPRFGRVDFSTVPDFKNRLLLKQNSQPELKVTVTARINAHEDDRLVTYQNIPIGFSDRAALLVRELRQDKLTPTVAKLEILEMLETNTLNIPDDLPFIQRRQLDTALAMFEKRENQFKTHLYQHDPVLNLIA